MAVWMVVEDEPNVYDLINAMFELWGIDGHTFVDGEEAVAWIDEVDSGRYSGELPEMALIDIRLPGIGGGDVAERLRQSPRLRDIAIVLTSAYVLKGAEFDALMAQSQADAFIGKPLPSFNVLRTRLENTIAERRARLAQQTATAPLASPALPAPGVPEQTERIASPEPHADGHTVAPGNPSEAPSLNGGTPGQSASLTPQHPAPPAPSPRRVPLA